MAAHADDPTIAALSELWRGVHPTQVVDDHGRKRPSSQAFRDEELSIVVEPDLSALGLGLPALQPYAAFAGRPIAAITAALARSKAQAVARDHKRDPKIDPPAHGFVDGQKSKGVQRSLAEGSAWVVPPSG